MWISDVRLLYNEYNVLIHMYIIIIKLVDDWKFYFYGFKNPYFVWSINRPGRQWGSSTEELSFWHKLKFSNPYIFATRGLKLLIFNA